MPGTRDGGLKAVATITKRLGSKQAASEWFASIGSEGGKNGHTGGFAAGAEGKERARVYGRIGGLKSRRGKATR